MLRRGRWDRERPRGYPAPVRTHRLLRLALLLPLPTALLAMRPASADVPPPPPARRSRSRRSPRRPRRLRCRRPRRPARWPPRPPPPPPSRPRRRAARRAAGPPRRPRRRLGPPRLRVPPPHGGRPRRRRPRRPRRERGRARLPRTSPVPTARACASRRCPAPAGSSPRRAAGPTSSRSATSTATATSTASTAATATSPPRRRSRRTTACARRSGLNDGTGRFTVKEASGVGAHAETTSAATFVDVDGDGVLDLFVGSWYVRYGEDLECFPSRLYRGRGDGTFEDVTEKAGMLGVAEAGRRDSRRPVYGVSHLDWDDDGDQDLVACAYGRQWNQLWRNDGDGTVHRRRRGRRLRRRRRRERRLPRRDPQGPAAQGPRGREAVPLEREHVRRARRRLRRRRRPRRLPGRDHPLVGRTVVGPLGPAASIRGAPGGWTFVREERGIVRTHEAARWNQGDIFAGWIDLGSDGLEDLFVASGDYPDDQRLRFFVQGADHRFADGTKELAVDWTNCSQPTVADFDLDGTADLALGNSNVRATAEQGKARTLRAAIFAQTRGKHFVRLLLEGKGPGGANRDAIGAKVTVRAGRLAATRVVFGSRGCGGHADERALTIGLGDATRVDELDGAVARRGEERPAVHGPRGRSRPAHPTGRAAEGRPALKTPAPLGAPPPPMAPDAPRIPPDASAPEPPPAPCVHGGGFFEAVGDAFDDLGRRETVINADVLDAWFPPSPRALAALREHLDWLVRTSPPTHARGPRAHDRARAGRAGGEPAHGRGLVGPDLPVPAGVADAARRARWCSTRRTASTSTCCGTWCGCRVDRFPLRDEDGFELDPDALAARRRGAAVRPARAREPEQPDGPARAPARAWSGSSPRCPSARGCGSTRPTSTTRGRRRVARAVRRARRNVVVCKSMSKVYALSGLRAAYLCTAPATVAGLRALTPPWAVSLPAQVAAVKALEDPEWYEARWHETATLREDLGAGPARAARLRGGPEHDELPPVPHARLGADHGGARRARATGGALRARRVGHRLGALAPRGATRGEGRGDEREDGGHPRGGAAAVTPLASRSGPRRGAPCRRSGGRSRPGTRS